MYRNTLLKIFLIYLPLFGLSSHLITTASAQSKKSSKPFTVIIDPGHGGHDPGAINRSMGIQEKNVTLSVGRRLRDLIQQRNPEVRVFMTRSDDRFISLQGRCDYANNHHGDLFISIHCNSAASSARGSETYVLGLEKFSQNLGVAMRENKAMLLEKDYKTTYRGFDPTSSESYIMFNMIQNRYLDQSIYLAENIEHNFRRKRPSRGVRQNIFWVQVYTAMPSVLVELGFISNPADGSYLNSDAGQSETALQLAQAFSRYYAHFVKGQEKPAYESDAKPIEPIRTEPDSTINTSEEKTDFTHQEVPKQESEKTESSSLRGTTYRIQIMASTKKLAPTAKEFSGIKEKITHDRSRTLYRYMVGSTPSLSEAKQLCRTLRKRFDGAYIVIFKNGVRTGEIYL